MNATGADVQGKFGSEVLERFSTIAKWEMTFPKFKNQATGSRLH
jgi:hypothetical protein